jgi:16S rRNA (guanine1516-N2)-methyltransferase
MSMNKLAIGYEADYLFSKAELLAERLHLPLDNHFLPRLSVGEKRLTLKVDKFSPLFVDFSAKSIQKRHDAGKKQGLVKACKPTSTVTILDVTAGWGRDAAVLASFGAKVHMIERNLVMGALLQDGLDHLDTSLKKYLQLTVMDAKLFLQQLDPEQLPEVIYIDPMHPMRQKSALVKKDMQILQSLLGTDEDAQELINLSLQRAKQRVVVKWPQKIAPLHPPTLSIPGKTVRFDVYITYS